MCIHIHILFNKNILFTCDKKWGRKVWKVLFRNLCILSPNICKLTTINMPNWAKKNIKKLSTLKLLKKNNNNKYTCVCMYVH